MLVLRPLRCTSRLFLTPRPLVAAASFHASSVRKYAHPQAIYIDPETGKHSQPATDKMTLQDARKPPGRLLVDHNNVKDLYHRYKSASSVEEKSTLVNTIIHELAMHSEAEEVSVYNVLEQKGLAKESAEFRDEHEQLEKVLYSVDWTKVDSAEFGPKFEHAIELFIKHSDREEDQVLKTLASKLTPEENDKLAKDFLAKRQVVPTRPHPAAPQSGGVVQKVLGTMTKPHDKIIETLQGRHFADLKYQHNSGKVEPIKIDGSLVGTSY
ncbi:hypothetical protein JCM8097_000444 [Rhodosporidiobolus ruineniae]